MDYSKWDRMAKGGVLIYIDILFLSHIQLFICIYHGNETINTWV